MQGRLSASSVYAEPALHLYRTGRRLIVTVSPLRAAQQALEAPAGVQTNTHEPRETSFACRRGQRIDDSYPPELSTCPFFPPSLFLLQAPHPPSRRQQPRITPPGAAVYFSSRRFSCAVKLLRHARKSGYRRKFPS
ncbi:hypothetical protein MRX96_039453 [Rhipicephalus microplus]